ncbi:MAG: hypothetical protein ABI354_01845 [Candidatus Saccharimonadales bacterium]
MNRLHTPDQFKTKKPLFGMAFIGLALAYLLVARALDTGSWWQYFGTLLLVILSVRLIQKGIKSKKKNDK